MIIDEIFIFARGGSKEIRNKNIIKINGKPLIDYTINFAKKINTRKIFVSTDSKKIENLALRKKVLCIKRPKKLASSTSAEIYSWKHAIRWYEKNYKKTLKNFISLPTTSPLRKIKDFIEAMNLFNKSNCDLLVAIYKPNHFPSFNIVKKQKKNFIKLYDNINTVSTRQKVNDVYNIATCFFIAKRDYILRTNRLYKGRIIGFEVSEESAFDLDTKFQLKILRKIL